MAAVREAQAQASQAGFEFKQQALDERSQVKAKIAVNEQSLRGAEGKLSRTEIRSPVDGVVNDVQVTTIGSYVQPGQKIMEVVPLGDKLLVETRVKPERHRLHQGRRPGAGQGHRLRFLDLRRARRPGRPGFGGLDLRREGEAGLFHGDRGDRQELPDGVGPSASDHSGNDDQHADHHRAEERPDLSA